MAAVPPDLSRDVHDRQITIHELSRLFPGLKSGEAYRSVNEWYAQFKTNGQVDTSKLTIPTADEVWGDKWFKRKLSRCFHSDVTNQMVQLGAITQAQKTELDDMSKSVFGLATEKNVDVVAIAVQVQRAYRIHGMDIARQMIEAVNPYAQNMEAYLMETLVTKFKFLQEKQAEALLLAKNKHPLQLANTGMEEHLKENIQIKKAESDPE